MSLNLVFEFLKGVDDGRIGVKGVFGYILNEFGG